MTASSSSEQQLRLLAVHAHPDDESSKGAATMAMYAAAGVDVMVATCTDGSRGDIQNPALEDAPPIPNVTWPAHGALRWATRQRSWGFSSAGSVLWIRAYPKAIRFRPCPPGGCFALQPLERATAPLVRLVRNFKPHVILSYDENGGYPHPDHIMAHKVAVEAFEAAGDPERYPGMGEPWAPSKLYYDRAFSPNDSVRCTSPWKKRGCSPPVCRAACGMAGSDAEGHTAPVAGAPDHHAS